MKRSALAIVLPLLLVACASTDAPPTAQATPDVPTTAAQAPARPQKTFGQAITEQAATPLATLLAQPGKFAASTVRTEGVVSAVCQHKGCWMEITDTSGKAHVKMAGHGFFVPRDASGHRAIVQGKVVSRDGDHCTEEAEAQTGSVAKVEIEATGVALVD